MLTNITPGFYKMRNGRMAFVASEDKTILGIIWMYGFYIKNGSVVSLYWRSESGRVVNDQQETSYDLVKRIEC